MTFNVGKHLNIIDVMKTLMKPNCSPSVEELWSYLGLEKSSSMHLNVSAGLLTVGSRATVSKH